MTDKRLSAKRAVNIQANNNLQVTTDALEALLLKRGVISQQPKTGPCLFYQYVILQSFSVPVGVP